MHFKMRFVRVLSIVAGLSLFSAAALADGKEGDFNLGRSSSGQLKVEFAADLFPFALPLSPEPELSGWAFDDPGFFSIDFDEPAEDFFQLANGANISFEIISIDAGFKVWTTFLTLLPPLVAPGDQWNIGEVPFDTHPWWNIDPTDPGYDPLDTEWSVTFRLIDIGTTGYSPSEPITATFTPEPAGLGALALGLLLAARRR